MPVHCTVHRKWVTATARHFASAKPGPELGDGGTRRRQRGTQLRQSLQHGHRSGQSPAAEHKTRDKPIPLSIESATRRPPMIPRVIPPSPSSPPARSACKPFAVRANLPLVTGRQARAQLWAATRQGWSKGVKHADRFMKFSSVVQRVRNPSGQSRARQVGSEPCDGEGNDTGDA